MRSPAIKICGMLEAENIKQVAGLSPDYLGFIFYEQSPRYVGEKFIVPDIAEEIKKVGVFVNEKLETIQLLIKKHQLDFVQLHGDETPTLCAALRHSGARVIKAFSIHSDFDWSSLNDYEECVDYFLFDTKGKHYGGNAVAFDWSLLTNYHQRIPFFLSGGLNPENIQAIKALPKMNLYALDINSGVETSPGLKDVSKVKSILNSIPIAIGTNF
jgi:phosphoribosylanthranilate isomerase